MDALGAPPKAGHLSFQRCSIVVEKYRNIVVAVEWETRQHGLRLCKRKFDRHCLEGEGN